MVGDREIRWDTYLGEFDVVRVTITDFLSNKGVGDLIDCLTNEVTCELMDAHPEVTFGKRISLRTVMGKIYARCGRQFVIVIDEWDAIFREYTEDTAGQIAHLDFLRDWLKDKEYIALAYITGILPIKKYGKHSALNMFREYSMTQPLQLAPFMGFTSEEVKQECVSQRIDYAGFEARYDGHRLSNTISEEMVLDGETIDETLYRDYETYCPYSVVNAMLNKQFANYWNQTETYEALHKYIEWDFDGLARDVAVLMDGGRVHVDIAGYQNDMTTFNTKDDILTMLVHLGYLAYDSHTKHVFIPNREVHAVFETSTRANSWDAVFRSLEMSRQLLEATWAGEEQKVADSVEQAHNQAANKTYNNEAALSYSIQLEQGTEGTGEKEQGTG